MQSTPSTVESSQPTLKGLCPVQPLDRVKFTPYDQSRLACVVEGTVFNAQDTSGGNPVFSAIA